MTASFPGQADTSAPERGRTPVGARLKHGWLLIVAHFGEVQTLLLVTLVYVLGIGPMGTGAAILRRDLLAKRSLRQDGSAWNDADTVVIPDLERAKRLF